MATKAAPGTESSTRTETETATRPGLIARVRSLPAARRASLLVGMLVVIGTVIRIPQLSFSLAEAYSFRQTQTAFTVREFAQHGINLFSSPLPVFGPDANVPMEFPLFQAIASLLVPLGASSDLAARLVALVSFQAVAVLLAILLIRWHGRAVAVLAVGLLQFLPYGLQWGAASLIDFMSVAFALLMVLGLDHWFSRGSIPWLVVASAAAVLGFLVKITSIPAWGCLVLVAIILLVRQRGWRATRWRILIGLAASPGLGFAAGVAWTVYADSIKRANEITLFLTSSELRAWNFGSFSQRISAETYGNILDRFWQDIAGFGFITLALAVAAAIFHRSIDARIRTLGWLGVAVSAPFVFLNLYYVHPYYAIAIYPAMVAAMSIGIVWVVRLIPGRPWQRAAVGAVGVTMLLVSTATSELGREDISHFTTERAIPGLSAAIIDRSDPGDLIVFDNCGWDPSFLYYAEREGVMFQTASSLGFWETHDPGDYSLYFRCGEEPTPGLLPAGWHLEETDSVAFYRIVED